MQRNTKDILHNPAARALVLVVLIIPISAYLGSSPVRRGFLYYTEVFAPAVVAAMVIGLWTWSWKWFWLTLGSYSVLTILIQILLHLLQ
jgi:ABC-type Mn2+/Zn2+ transport system permease subunit